MRSLKRYALAIILISTSILLIYFLLSSDSFNDERQSSDNQIQTRISSWYPLKLPDSPAKTAGNKLEDFDSNPIKISETVQLKSINATPKAYSAKDSLMKYIRSPLREVKSFDFSTCSLTNCFDISVCNSTAPLKVFVVPKISDYSNSLFNFNSTTGQSNLTYTKIVNIIRNSHYYEPDPKKACIFILEEDTLDRDLLSPSFNPHLNTGNIFNEDFSYGMNHLIFNLYSGSWPEYKENDFAGLKINAAILAKASNSFFHHRAGYDISLPLFPYNHPITDRELSKDWLESFDLLYSEQYVDNRTYFLSFKGKRYVFGTGSETRNSLYHLNNQRDVVMLTTCRHGKKWRELSDNRCTEDESNYDQYNFVDLLKDSKFCLIPRGRRLGSYRFLEALSFGCIPVVLSDSWVRPFDDIIDWSSAIIQFEENMLLQVPDILRDLDRATIHSMRRNCLTIYRRYFSTIERIVLTSLSLIDKRIKHLSKN